MKMKKTCCLVLALVLALGLLSACGGEGGPTNTPAPEFAYVAKYTELEGEFEGMNNACFAGGRIYFMSSVQDGEITESYPSRDENGNPILDENGEPVMEEYTYPNYVTALFSMNADGSDLKRVGSYAPTAIPEGAQGGSWVSAFTAAPDGRLIVAENVSYSTGSGEPGAATGSDLEVVAFAADAVAVDVPVTSDAPDVGEFTYVEKYLLRVFDQQGNETASIDLSQFNENEEEYFYMSGMVADGDRGICVSVGNELLGISFEGELLYRIPAGEGIDGFMSLVNLSDGSAAVLAYANDYSEIKLLSVDAETGKLVDNEVDFDRSVYRVYPFGGDYDFGYNKGESFFGFDADTGKETKLLTWINCDVDGNNLSGVFPQENGDIVCLTTEYGNEGGSTNYLISLVKTPYDQVPQKTTLTLACTGLDYTVKNEILKFNRMDGDYRIEVRDYSEYNTDEDYTAGNTKLITEIGAGAVPDILITNGLPIDTFSARGYFTDLWSFIDADAELGGREALVEPFLNAISQDGKLYWITNSFNLVTLAGPSSIVGTEPGWTYDDFYAALDQMPEGCEILSLGTTKQSVFDSICNLNLDSFVDWGTGTCNFDSEEFINLLKFTDLFPKDFDWENHEWSQDDNDDVRIKEGRQLLMSVSLGYPFDMVYYSQSFGGNMTLIGFPDVPGSGAVFSTYSPGFAISETCKEKDAAWRFVSGFLKEDYQSYYGSYGFSVNRAVFDKSFQDALERENSNYVMTDSGEMQEQKVRFTQEDMDMLMNVINNTQLFGQSYASTQDQLQKIVSEEVSSYFAGEKSAEDVAAMIQNRASIYVSEQR